MTWLESGDHVAAYTGLPGNEYQKFREEPREGVRALTALNKHTAKHPCSRPHLYSSIFSNYSVHNHTSTTHLLHTYRSTK